MSAKLRVTLWISLMAVLLAAMVLVFVLVINGSAITDDPAGSLVKIVLKNADNIEFDRGEFEWDDLDVYRRGVYCSFYDESGNMVYGAVHDAWNDVSLPLEANVIRTVDVGGTELYVYDTLVDMDITALWVRGMITTDDSSGLMHTILVLTCTLLPAILVLSIGISYSSAGSLQLGAISLSGLAVGSIVGIVLNAIMPGKDYVYGEDKQGDESVNFIVQ